MEYTAASLGKLAGLTARTIRYYDEIGLLSPCRISSGGYRIYGQAEVDRLHQILLYREMGLDLSSIKKMLDSSDFNKREALSRHIIFLTAEKARIEALIENVSKTIDEMDGGIKMSDNEKFAGLKRSIIEENEKKYGKEIREKYGNEKIEQSNQKILNMTLEEFEGAKLLEEEIKSLLIRAARENDPAGPAARELCRKHEMWIKSFWPEGTYSKKAHALLGEMYVSDERFKKYYDDITDGGAQFLKSALDIYCK